MRIVLDTSSLIRLFTNDFPKKAAKIEDLLKKEKDLIIPDVVFPELEYVLTSGYSSNRSQIHKSYEFLLTLKNVKIHIRVRKAILIYKNTKLDMADCIIAASSLGGTLASFDKELLKTKGVKSFWK